MVSYTDCSTRVWDSDQLILEAQKYTVCEARRRKVAPSYIEEEKRSRQCIFELPEGQINFIHILRCSSFTILSYRSTPHALNMNKIDSAKDYLVRTPHP
jgi:hypothetical protein